MTTRKFRSCNMLRDLTLMVVFCVLIFGSGCDGEQNTSKPKILSGSASKGTKGDFVQGIDLLTRWNEVNSTTAETKILSHLRNWLKDKEPNKTWVADQLAGRLPENYRPYAGTTLLARNSIDRFDIIVLREANWLNDISRSVFTKNTIAPELQTELDHLTKTVDANHVADLSDAMILFDWVVRNISTDAEPDGNQGSRYESDISLFAWESLLYGHGTVNEKSRIFILLCRQLGLDVVMLGIDRDGEQPRDWLPAVLLDNQLYLFEMRLGIPLPTKNGSGIATLEHLMEHPEILRSLDVDGHIYSMGAESLQKVVAMIEATPFALSQRMANVEAEMTGKVKFAITVRPSSLKQKLEKCRGVQKTQIWTFAYKGLAERADKVRNPAVHNAMQREYLFFSKDNLVQDDENRFRQQTGSRMSDQTVSLGQARVLQFRGEFTDTDSKKGARSHYLGLRKSDAYLQGIRDYYANSRLPRDQAERMISQIEYVAGMHKQHASFFLGITTYERGDYNSTINYFQKRCLDEFPDGIWSAHAKYNLGRALEARAVASNDSDFLKQAIAVYKSDRDSAQSHQCYVRAERLQNASK